jgi:hypothetical protein
MASFLDEIFGSKPATAPYVPTQLPPEQIKTLKANIAAFPDINQLGSLYEQYMLNEMGTAIPDFSNILASGGQLTEDMINQAASLVSGQVPQDVQDQIMRSDAFTSMLSGGGPAFDRSLTARDLGLTSLNLIQQGGQLAGEAGNAAQRWAGLASGMIMSPSGMMITPLQMATFDMQNRLYEQATQQTRNNIAAAPNPGLQALNQWVEQIGGTLIGASLGGGMGGMGGKGANYMTSYNPNQYGSDAGMPSDITNPGYALPSGYPGTGIPTAAQTSGNVFNVGPTSYNDTIPLPASTTSTATTADYSQLFANAPWNLYGTSDFNVTRG